MNIEPKVSVYFESPTSAKVRHLCDVRLTPLHFPNKIEKLLLHKSFGISRFVVHSSPGGEVFAMVNGESSPATMKNPVELRIPLSTDNENYVIHFVVDGSYATTIELVVHHHFECGQLGSGGKTTFYWPKWYPNDIKLARAEIIRLLGKIGTKTTTNAVSVSQSSIAGFDKKNSRIGAHNLALGLSKIIIKSNKHDYLLDFARNISGGLDIMGIIDAVKGNPLSLELCPQGPFVIDGQSYTTAIAIHTEEKSSECDISNLILVLDSITAGLFRMDLPGAAYLLKRAISGLYKRGFTMRSGANLSTAHRAILHSKMQSPITRRMQDTIKQLVMILTCHDIWKQRETLQVGVGPEWRDFDLFQNLVAVMAEKLLIGSSEDSRILRSSRIEGEFHILLNPNADGGFKELGKIMRGWRDSSIQPSDYKPDLVVIYNKKTPIMIDAKFRTASSPCYVASPAAVKEVQSYLDEFGRASAIIVVPVFPPRENSANGGTFLDTRKSGVEYIECSAPPRLIAVVEMRATGTDDFCINLSNALKRCAEIEEKFILAHPVYESSSSCPPTNPSVVTGQ